MTADVSLREVDAANVRAVCDLQLLVEDDEIVLRLGRHG